jgi:hypothetical protein
MELKIRHLEFDLKIKMVHDERGWRGSLPYLLGNDYTTYKKGYETEEMAVLATMLSLSSTNESNLYGSELHDADCDVYGECTCEKEIYFEHGEPSIEDLKSHKEYKLYIALKPMPIKKKKKETAIKVDRHAVYAKYNNNCAYCGNRLEFKDMQVDHFVPKTKFQGEGADELENLMPSCKECNMDKGNMLIDEWRERLHNASETVKSSKILASALKFNMIEIKPFDGKFYYETN